MICLLAAVTALRAAAVGRRRLAAHDALLSLLRDAVAVALPMATLHGHNAAVQSVLMNEAAHQLISVGVDKVVKVARSEASVCPG